MPLGRAAKKKLRQDKKRTGINLRVKNLSKATIKKFRAKPSEKLMSEVFRELDRAAKKNVIHANKAARLKSRLSKLIKKTTPRKKKTVV